MRFTDNQSLDTASMANLDILAGTDVSSGTDKKFTLANLASWFLGQFNGLSLAGNNQTVQAAIDEMSETKADADGEYDNLVVGTSKQLLSDSYTEDLTPYKFRRSPYTDRMSESIVGASCVWNQLCETGTAGSFTSNGITWTRNGDGTYTANGTATADSYCTVSESLTGKENHVMVITGCPSGGSASTYMIFDSYLTYSLSADYGSGRIFKKSASEGRFFCRLYVWSGATVNNIVFKPQAFDLTAMFGSAVADALYAMGDDGIKLFRSWYPNDYYPSSNPTLEHVSGLEAHDMVGFNAFDKSTAATGKFVNTDGTEATDIKCFATDYIRVIPNTTYYINHAIGRSVHSTAYCEYDESKNFVAVGTALVGTDVAMTITVGANTHYVRVNSGIGNLDALCINLSDPTRNGQYKPYSKHSYALDASLTLRGLIKYDSANGFYADGDVYEADGTVTRKYAVVDLGTRSWSYVTDSDYANGGYFQSNAVAAQASASINIRCSKYTSAEVLGKSAVIAEYGNDADKIIYTANNSTRVYVLDSAYNDAASFKAAMSGVYMVYEKSTVETESAEPYDAIQITDGTEEYITDCLAPVGHESKYYANLRSKIEGLPTDFSAIICATEPTSKASKNYAVGDYLIYGNTLYKVTTAIAANATLTVGTNITATTIMAEIKALQ